MSLAVLAVIASGCSIAASGGSSLNTRCDRTYPALDTAAAITATVIAIAVGKTEDNGDGSSDSSVNGRVLGVGVGLGISAAVGFSKTSQCRARATVPLPPTDKFLGARRWSTTYAVRPTEAPVVALERAYQRAAIVCEGFGFSSLRSTPLSPWRPRRMTLVYKCH